MGIILSLVWAPQQVMVESLFRHYNGLGEVAGYLMEKSQLRKQYGIEVMVNDCTAKVYTAAGMARIVYDSTAIAICINMNNIIESLDTAGFFRSIDRSIPLIAYGEAVCCNPRYFDSQGLFDYVVSNGQYELGLEVALAKLYNLDFHFLNKELRQSGSYKIKDSIIELNDKVLLPPEQWGVPSFKSLPYEEYKKIGEGELHITACKGCPFRCSFCNEKYVSTKMIRYRPKEQIISFMNLYHDKFESIYLDSSTFTFDRDWVIDFCQEIINFQGELLPWKTCTRLDCIDEELIEIMSRAGCQRISIGVESINTDIQISNNKIIDYERLGKFADTCRKHGIKPRALLILGLEGQTKIEIESMESVFTELGLESRYRILQNFQFLLSDDIDNITTERLRTLNRWIYNNPLEGIDDNIIRRMEYPENRKKNFV